MRFKVDLGTEQPSFEIFGLSEDTLELEHEGQRYAVEFLERGPTSLLLVDGAPFEVVADQGRASAQGIEATFIDQGAAAKGLASAGAQGEYELRAPMPGRVVNLYCKLGQHVEKGEALLVLEAMKMENELVAAAAGFVKEILTAPGATIEAGAPLLRLSGEDSA
jgi:biotin carboxyl carrier protein